MISTERVPLSCIFEIVEFLGQKANSRVLRELVRNRHLFGRRAGPHCLDFRKRRTSA